MLVHVPGRIATARSIPLMFRQTDGSPAGGGGPSGGGYRPVSATLTTTFPWAWPSS